MSVGEQHQVDRRQVADLDARSLDSLQQKEPVGEIGIDQDAQIVELDQELCVTDPRHRHLARIQAREFRPLVLSLAPGQQRLPHHLVKERPRTERLGRREILERARQALFLSVGPMHMGTFDFHSVGYTRATYTSALNKKQSPRVFCWQPGLILF